MQYISHNFAENYKRFTESKEVKQRNDMLLDEVAKLIVFDNAGLMIAISKSGFDITRQPSRKDYVDFFEEYIPKSNVLRNNLARLIIINNSGNKTIRHKSNEFNKKTYTIGDKTYGKIKNKEPLKTSQKELSNSLKFNFTGSLNSKVEQHTINKMTMDNKIVSKEDMAKAIKKTKIKTAIYTTIILVGGYFAVNYAMKKYVSSSLFNSGGNIEPQSVEHINNEPIPAVNNQPSDGFDEFGLKIEQ